MSSDLAWSGVVHMSRCRLPAATSDADSRVYKETPDHHLPTPAQRSCPWRVISDLEGGFAAHAVVEGLADGSGQSALQVQHPRREGGVVLHKRLVVWVQAVVRLPARRTVLSVHMMKGVSWVE